MNIRPIVIVLPKPDGEVSDGGRHDYHVKDGYMLPMATTVPKQDADDGSSSGQPFVNAVPPPEPRVSDPESGPEMSSPADALSALLQRAVVAEHAAHWARCRIAAAEASKEEPPCHPNSSPGVVCAQPCP